MELPQRVWTGFRRGLWTGAVTAILALPLGCKTAPGARPDDMSASDHRHEADAHGSEAAKHDARYDPSATATEDVVIGETETEHIDPTGVRWPVSSYNPTADHALEADRHRKHADHHRKAAKALERFEEAECAGFPAATRAVCPLLGNVLAAEDIEGGVRITVHERLPREPVLDHIRCHFAFGRTGGMKGMDSCPLYLPGVEAELGTDGRTIEITTVGDAAELRRRTATHVLAK